jgi:hypothetical protein
MPPERCVPPCLAFLIEMGSCEPPSQPHTSILPVSPARVARITERILAQSFQHTSAK